MLFFTTTGHCVWGLTKAEAVSLASMFGLGEIDIALSVRRHPMSLKAAQNLRASEHDLPRCGYGWPANAYECDADIICAEADSAHNA